MCRHPLKALLLATSLLSLPSTSLRADDYLLTIGGGPVPSGNQLSLENNVRYLQRVLEHLKLTGIKQTILFSDGGDPQRDLQFEGVRDPDDLRMLIAEMIGPSNGTKFDYRSSSLPVVDGPATPDAIDQNIKDLSKQLSEPDRLLIYFTGHGGRPRGSQSTGFRGRRPPVEERPATTTDDNETDNSDSKDEEDKKDEPQEEPQRRPPESNTSSQRRDFANNIMHLWDGKDLSVTEWTQKLDEIPTDVPVVVIMVQCYSGGFGNFVFKGGDPANGLADQPRCGFFSTIPERVAAGCTPRVNEADYREYSSYFFEAICGQSRTGLEVELPDYNNDGSTSFLDAHTYTVLNANTIDIPVRSSDIYLRQFSKTDGDFVLLTPHSPINEILAIASPYERAVIEGLSQKFDLTGDDRAKEVEEALKKCRDEKQKIDTEIRRKRVTVSNAKRDISTLLRKVWPELATPWHPENARLLTEHADEIRDTITKHERYQELQTANEELKTLNDESEQKELQIVKLERLNYWLETVSLAANLPLIAGEEKYEGYSRLVKLESSQLTLQQPSPSES